MIFRKFRRYNFMFNMTFHVFSIQDVPEVNTKMPLDKIRTYRNHSHGRIGKRSQSCEATASTSHTTPLPNLLTDSKRPEVMRIDREVHVHGHQLTDITDVVLANTVPYVRRLLGHPVYT